MKLIDAIREVLDSYTEAIGIGVYSLSGEPIAVLGPSEVLGHAASVAIYARETARSLGLEEPSSVVIERGGELVYAAVAGDLVVAVALRGEELLARYLAMEALEEVKRLVSSSLPSSQVSPSTQHHSS